jgi:hypothetical protein
VTSRCLALERLRSGERQPERGYGCLAAVVTADARRFRVIDEALAAVLTDSGADLVGETPDVEIRPRRRARVGCHRRIRAHRAIARRGRAS